MQKDQYVRDFRYAEYMAIAYSTLKMQHKLKFEDSTHLRHPVIIVNVL